MKPCYEEFLRGATRWSLTHEGVNYQLNFHGYREDETKNGFFLEGHPGTWCYYLIIPEQMYPHRWSDFACVRNENGFEHHGPGFEDDMFDSGITWSSSEPYWDRKLNRQFDASKVGCDYAHLWHREMGYPDTFESVKSDAINTVNKFLRAHPDYHLRSRWSGVYGLKEEFYTAINGALVHKTDEIPENYDLWKPKDAPEPPDPHQE